MDPQPDAPEWMRAWLPRFPTGVRLKDGRLVDDVCAAELELGAREHRLLSRIDGATDVREIERLDPGAWRLLLDLNEAHLLNFERVPRIRLRPRWRRLRSAHETGARVPVQRCALDEGSFGVRGWQVARAMVRLACMQNAPTVLCALVLVAGIVVASNGSGASAVCIATGLAGYWLHELGHAQAAHASGIPAYIAVMPRGVSVWIRQRSGSAQRWFALAGPLPPVLAGVSLLAASRILPHWIPSPLSALMAAPLLAHLLYLLPCCADGRLLLGRAGLTRGGAS